MRLESAETAKSMAIPSTAITLIMGWLILEEMNSPLLPEFRETAGIILTGSTIIGFLALYVALKRDKKRIMA